MKDSESVNNNIQISPELLQQLTINQERQQDDEIDLAELWRAIWAGKWIVIAITSLFAVASVFYALSLPNIYKSEALLAPAEQESGGLGGMASQLGGLASLAGVSLGGRGTDKTALALEILQSRSFIFSFIENYKITVPLMATEEWNAKTNELVLDSEIYDSISKTWIRDVSFPFSPKPSKLESFNEFRKRLSVSQDKMSSMITVSLEFYSPVKAKEWLELLVRDINEEMRKRDLVEAENSIAYLKEQLKNNNSVDLNNVIYQLIEEQTKTIMFAKANKEYVMVIIDPPLVPEVKYGPKRMLIVSFSALLGGFISILIILTSYFRKHRATR
ncbi:Wzz/FepE/Etk N-terminal domain-containing protein [Psychrobium sp. nBUS_13]|uniref:Wzz/FepE/Etk N-terminal domain-containing protein n=1 Tax=Psychrobium sp. nBUS_13 TaxID=3395319 RepID=UPI003EB74526